jgi:hypothetical protein
MWQACPARGNRDASLCEFADPARPADVRHADRPPDSCAGSAVRRGTAIHVGDAPHICRHSSDCHGHSAGRSSPAHRSTRSCTADKSPRTPGCTSEGDWTTPCITGIKAMRRRSSRKPSPRIEGPGFWLRICPGLRLLWPAYGQSIAEACSVSPPSAAAFISIPALPATSPLAPHERPPDIRMGRLLPLRGCGGLRPISAKIRNVPDHHAGSADAYEVARVAHWQSDSSCEGRRPGSGVGSRLWRAESASSQPHATDTADRSSRARK